jgi:cyclopropane-fatty-acyl-phospholipid synthase
MSSLIGQRFLKTLEKLHSGYLTLHTPEGQTYTFGNKAAIPVAVMTIRDWRSIVMAAARGDIGMGEAYIEGLWDADDVDHLFRIFLLNIDVVGDYAHGDFFNRLFFRLLNTVLRRNHPKQSAANIRAHYDVSTDFYKLWLDPSMTYSSALYESEASNLFEAQQAKYARLANRVKPAGEHVFEIGCGFGGFAEHAASKGFKHSGVTNSRAHFDYATNRMEGRAKIILDDYRNVQGLYDSIVSIEMFEAVGEAYWPDYFKTVQRLMKKQGTAMIQTIAIGDEFFEGYRKRSDFIRHYTFPGGMLPSLKRFQEEAEKVGLAVKEIFTFGHDYVRTLREWIMRFDAARDSMVALGFDDETMRSWRFYLSICAASFAVDRSNVAQIELVHA